MCRVCCRLFGCPVVSLDVLCGSIKNKTSNMLYSTSTHSYLTYVEIPNENTNSKMHRHPHNTIGSWKTHCILHTVHIAIWCIIIRQYQWNGTPVHSTLHPCRGCIRIKNSFHFQIPIHTRTQKTNSIFIVFSPNNKCIRVFFFFSLPIFRIPNDKQPMIVSCLSNASVWLRYGWF